MSLNTTQLDLEIENAKTAFSNHDFITARKFVALAQMTLSSLHDYGIADRNIIYRKNIVDSLSKVIKEHEQLIRSSSGRSRTIRGNFVRS